MRRTSYLCSEAQTCISNSGFYFNNYQEDLKLVTQLFISFILVYFSYSKMHMFNKEHKIISQLLNSFKNAASTIRDILTNDNTQERLLKRHIRLKYHVSDIIPDNLRDCLIRDSDISTVIDNIKSQTQPTTDNNTGSFWELLKKVFTFLFYPIICPIMWYVNNRMKAQQEGFFKALEKELNYLADTQETKLSQMNQSKPRVSDPPLDKDPIIEDECRFIIQDLGQEYLIRRIEWMLAVNERDIHKIQ